MNRKEEIKLIECHILMSEAIRGYEDRGLQSNRLFEIRQYRNQIPENKYKKIEEFVNENIRPMVYDVDYFSFLKDEQYGSFDGNNHFIIDSDRSLEDIIFLKYIHVHELLEKLNKFASDELHLNYDC